MRLVKRTRARFVETELADDDSRIGNFGARGERGGDDRRLILTVGNRTAYYDMELSREETLDLARWMQTQSMAGDAFDAAATELLAACKAVQRDIDGFIMGEWESSEEAWQSLSDRLQDAIAKAE